MLVWLDGRTNTKAQPQENFGREIMELFTVGVGNYTEADVYAGGARVHAAGTWRGPAAPATDRSTTRSSTTRDQHETAAKTFSFPIYPDGGKTIPARSAADGHAGRHRSDQRASPRIPTPARYLATQAVPLLRQRVRRRQRRRSSIASPRSICRTASTCKPVMREVLSSPEFWDRQRLLHALLVAGGVRRPRDQGHRLDRLLGQRRADAADQHGPELYEPPDVAAGISGQSWFSTGAMLARMNFASTLAANQKFKLRDCGDGATVRSPEVAAVVSARRG